MENDTESGMSEDEKVNLILKVVKDTPGIRTKELIEMLVISKEGIKGLLSKPTFYRTLKAAKDRKKLKWREKGRETYYYPLYYMPDEHSLCFLPGGKSELEQFLLDECKRLVSSGLAIESHRVKRIMPPGAMNMNQDPRQMRSELKWEEWDFDFRCKSLFRFIVWMEQVRGFRIPRTWECSDYSILYELYEDEAYSKAKEAEEAHFLKPKDDDTVIPLRKSKLKIPSFRSWLDFYYVAIEYISTYIDKGKVSEREVLKP
jgi:hypothetical protein